ncbi:N-acetyltransferase family protein [Leifsonia sp. YAF41]|uniref:GNAT family N-acetyltransferase n=1 Tax=Leifsonia sp. YAF41 TaxID=3233086 RepID=UPI003F96E88A
MIRFEISQPTVADAPVIAALHVDKWREAYGHLLPADFFTEKHLLGRQEQWDQSLRSPRDDWTIRVARTGEGIVGFAVAGPSSGPEGQHLPRERQLHSLYVLADSHGTGVGQALLDAVLGEAPAMLWVATENPRAIAFYRRNGFEFDGVETFDPSAPGITHAQMVR